MDVFTEYLLNLYVTRSMDMDEKSVLQRRDQIERQLSAFEKLVIISDAGFSIETLQANLQLIIKEGAKDKGMLRIRSLNDLKESLSIYCMSAGKQDAELISVDSYFSKFFESIEHSRAIKDYFDDKIYACLFSYFFYPPDDMRDVENGISDDRDIKHVQRTKPRLSSAAPDESSSNRPEDSEAAHQQSHSPTDGELSGRDSMAILKKRLLKDESVHFPSVRYSIRLGKMAKRRVGDTGKRTKRKENTKRDKIKRKEERLRNILAAKKDEKLAKFFQDSAANPAVRDGGLKKLSSKQKLNYTIGELSTLNDKWESLYTNDDVDSSIFEEASSNCLQGLKGYLRVESILRLLPDIFAKCWRSVTLVRAWISSAVATYEHRLEQVKPQAEYWKQIQYLDDATLGLEKNIKLKEEIMRAKIREKEILSKQLATSEVMHAKYSECTAREKTLASTYKATQNERDIAYRQLNSLSNKDTSYAILQGLVTELDRELIVLFDQLRVVGFQLEIIRQDGSAEMSARPNLTRMLDDVKQNMADIEETLPNDRAVRREKIKEYVILRGNCSRAWRLLRKTNPDYFISQLADSLAEYTKYLNYINELKSRNSSPSEINQQLASFPDDARADDARVVSSLAALEAADSTSSSEETVASDDNVDPKFFPAAALLLNEEKERAAKRKSEKTKSPALNFQLPFSASTENSYSENKKELIGLRTHSVFDQKNQRESVQSNSGDDWEDLPTEANPRLTKSTNKELRTWTRAYANNPLPSDGDVSVDNDASLFPEVIYNTSATPTVPSRIDKSSAGDLPVEQLDTPYSATDTKAIYVLKRRTPPQPLEGPSSTTVYILKRSKSASVQVQDQLPFEEISKVENRLLRKEETIFKQRTATVSLRRTQYAYDWVPPIFDQFGRTQWQRTHQSNSPTQQLFLDAPSVRTFAINNNHTIWKGVEHHSKAIYKSPAASLHRAVAPVPNPKQRTVRDPLTPSNLHSPRQLKAANRDQGKTFSKSPIMPEYFAESSESDDEIFSQKRVSHPSKDLQRVRKSDITYGIINQKLLNGNIRKPTNYKIE